MTRTRITKLEAARRQLEVAIDMHFRGDDPMAVHTLVSAAGRIVRDLHQHHHPDEWNDLMEIIALDKKELMNSLTVFANFCKHADTDPSGTMIDITPRRNEDFICLSLSFYGRLSPLTFKMVVFLTWEFLVNPNEINIEKVLKIGPNFSEEMREYIDRAKKSSPEERLALHEDIALTIKRHPMFSQS